MPFEKSVADVLFMNGEYEAAAEMYLEGAREGEEIASFNYGYCLLHGLGVETDYEAAKSFFTYARDMTGGESSYNLATLYLEGRGVEKDYRVGLQYMSDAADLGCVEAMLYLGMVYTTGYVLSPEITSICMIPFHKSEMRRDTEYMLPGDTELLDLDEERRFSTVKADARRAFEYFSEAASADPTYVEDLVAKGKFLFAKCYIDGMGTDPNIEVGLTLMLKAGKSGSEDAVAFLSENGITERLLLEWKSRDKKEESRK
ncbi:MAG: sel1 repeat family protein [Ruminococcaceae bacterium]|nr:sel1 repeat family protein [Oscillospiraceae bacterium]